MDQSIINGCRKNMRKSQKKAFEALYPKMMGMCLRYAKNKAEAEDFLHDGMIQAFTKIDQYKETGSFEGWVRTVIRNSILNTFKKRKEIFIDVEEALDETELEIVDEVKGIPTEVLLGFVQELPISYRTAFNLHVFEDLKHREIAEALNISEGSSKSNLFKAKKKLAEQCNNWVRTRN